MSNKMSSNTWKHTPIKQHNKQQNKYDNILHITSFLIQGLYNKHTARPYKVSRISHTKLIKSVAIFISFLILPLLLKNFLISHPVFHLF